MRIYTDGKKKLVVLDDGRAIETTGDVTVTKDGIIHFKSPKTGLIKKKK